MISKHRSTCICVYTLLFYATLSTVDGLWGRGSSKQGQAHHCQSPAIIAYAEQSYRKARKLSDELRTSLGSVESSTTSSIPGGRAERVWDLFYPDYNCPLVKERIGRIGTAALVEPSADEHART